MKFVLLTLLVMLPAWGGQKEQTKTSLAARKSLGEKELKELSEILSKNDELFNAFLKKDAILVEKKSKELFEVTSRSEGSSLQKVKAKVDSLKNISAKKSNEKNLEAYEAFLNPLIKVVETYDAPGRFNIFSCPMVKKSWIQDTKTNKDVRNVYAMEMLECGTQDTKF